MKSAPNSRTNLDKALDRFAGTPARAVELRNFMANADLDLRRVRDVCVRLFKYRKRQAWPPTIAVNAGWSTSYDGQKADLPVLPTVEEAVAWTQRLIDRIDAAR